jgi:membrane-associated phospholipid phosphatase
MAITTPRFFNCLLRSLLRQEWVKWLQRKYPAIFQWIIRRFDSGHFEGLPLTLAMGTLLINGIMFSEIAENLVNSEPMVRMDQQVSLFLFAHRSMLVSKVLLGITQLASQWVSVGITVLAIISLLWKKRRLKALAFSLVMSGVGLSIYYGKLFFQRVRPLHIAYYPETTFSFPSGHSAAAMALFGMLAYLCIQEAESFRKRFIVGLLGAWLILAIGFSRIYLGVHFLSDVAGGYLVGATWLVLGVSTVEWHRFRQRLLLP